MTTLPSGPPTGRLRGLGAPVGAGAAVLAAGTALLLRDPHRHGSWGFCPLFALTGLDCPFCGSLRAVNDLGRGQLGAAVGSNALLVLVLLPLGTLIWCRWVAAAARPGGTRTPVLSPRWSALLLVLALVFGVLRNLPFASALLA